MARKKSHCHRGHLLSEENVYYKQDGSRSCRACMRSYQLDYKQRHPVPTGTMSPEIAEQVMAALRCGKTLNSICGGKLNGKKVEGERLTYYHNYRNYCAAQPEFASEATALLAQNTAAANVRKGAAKRNMTHCKRGHPLTKANLYFDRGDAHRKCKLCTAINGNHPPLPSLDQISRVTAALNAGKTIAEICWGRIDGKKVTRPILMHRNLKRYRQENPDFDQFVCSVISGSLSRAMQRRWHPRQFRINIVRAQSNEYRDIEAMLPNSLPWDDRQEISQAIMTALVDGSLRRDQVKDRIRYFVTAHNRDARKYGVGQYGLVSLDAPIFADSKMTRGDTIVRGLWDRIT